MFPLRDDAPVRFPWLVTALVAANALVFAVLTQQGGSAQAELLERFGLVPRELLRAWAEPAAARPAVWLTPLSAMFLHGGLPHLLGNLLYLGVFGGAVERRLGPSRCGLLYAACGLAAAAAALVAAPGAYRPWVGASGAVSGLLGAWALAAREGPSPRPGRAALCLAVWVALQLVSGLSGRGAGGEAWWPHLAGFAAGAVLGRSLRGPSATRA